MTIFTPFSGGEGVGIGAKNAGIYNYCQRSKTPRALARFQTFPDWYQLPKKLTLAGKIIGNAVPCLGYQRILESLI